MYREIMATGGRRLEELRFLMIGKTGHGKSLTGNSLLGARFFEVSQSSSSCTRDAFTQEAERFGYAIRVTDTPGIFDTELSTEEVRRVLMKCLFTTIPGLDAILFVLKRGEKFTQELQDTQRLFFDWFGPGVEQYAFLVVTDCDSMEDANHYLSDRPHDSLTELANRCGNRIIPINNRGSQDLVEIQAEDMIKQIVRRKQFINQGSFTDVKYEIVQHIAREKDPKEVSYESLALMEQATCIPGEVERFLKSKGFSFINKSTESSEAKYGPLQIINDNSGSSDSSGKNNPSFGKLPIIFEDSEHNSLKRNDENCGISPTSFSSSDSKTSVHSIVGTQNTLDTMNTDTGSDEECSDSDNGVDVTWETGPMQTNNETLTSGDPIASNVPSQHDNGEYRYYDSVQPSQSTHAGFKSKWPPDYTEQSNMLVDERKPKRRTSRRERKLVVSNYDYVTPTNVDPADEDIHFTDGPGQAAGSQRVSGNRYTHGHDRQTDNNSRGQVPSDRETRYTHGQGRYSDNTNTNLTASHGTESGHNYNQHRYRHGGNDNSGQSVDSQTVGGRRNQQSDQRAPMRSDNNPSGRVRPNQSVHGRPNQHGGRSNDPNRQSDAYVSADIDDKTRHLRDNANNNPLFFRSVCNKFKRFVNKRRPNTCTIV